MQKERHTGTFQRHQYTQDSTRKPQGQGPQTSKQGLYTSTNAPT